MRVTGSRITAVVAGLLILCVLAVLVSPVVPGLPTHLRVKRLSWQFVVQAALPAHGLVGAGPTGSPASRSEIFQASPPAPILRLICVRNC
jgi:hypothetical protein